MDDQSQQKPIDTSAESSQQPSGMPLGATHSAPEVAGSSVPPAPKAQGKLGLKKILIAAAVLLVLVAGAVVFIKHREDTAAKKQSTVSTKVYKVGVLDELDVFFGGSVTGFNQKITTLG